MSQRNDEDGVRFVNPILFMIHRFHALDRLPFLAGGEEDEIKTNLKKDHYKMIQMV